MTPTPLRITAALAAAALLLAGCSGDPAPEAPSQPVPSVGSASPSATSTLTVEEQQAVDEATAVVLAREQMFYDLLADPARPLNDLNDVVTQPQLERDLASLRKLSAEVAAGSLVVNSTGPVTIASAAPVKFDLAGDQPTVTLAVCVDNTAASGTDDGKPWNGSREVARYRIVKTTYLPAPGWALAKVLPPEGFDQPQAC